MIDIDKLYSLVPILMTLKFIQGHRITEKPEILR